MEKESMNTRRTNKPFIILRTRVVSLGRQSIVYEQVYTPETNYRIIPRALAMQMIRQNNMHKVAEDIWEMEGEPFLKNFKGYYAENSQN